MGGCPLVFLAEAGIPWPQLWGVMPQHMGKPMYHLVDVRRAEAEVERGTDGGRFPSADSMFSSGYLGRVSPVPIPLPTLAGWCP